MTNFTNNHLSNMFWGTTTPDDFVKGIQHCINAVTAQVGIYAGDSLFTYNRNFSFLDDLAFMAAVGSNVKDEVERAIIWRTSVLL